MRIPLFAVLFASVLAAQELPEGSALMKACEEAIKRCRSLEYKTAMTSEMTRGGQTMKMGGEIVNAIVNPGKTRFESRIQGVTMLTVSDGESTWTYNSMTRQYAKKSAALGPMAMLSAMGVNSLPDTSKAKIAEKTLGAETLEMEGQKHDCWLVENHVGEFAITEPQPVTVKDFTIRYWIDKKTKLDLQMTVSMKVDAGAGDMEMLQKFTKTEMKIDQPLPDAEFTFTPPAGAQLVDNVMGAGMPNADLAGKDAAPFEVKSLEGKPYSLAALKGKPVLLDFWASWCGPCRKALPDLETLNQEFKDKGLVILGVNTGEDREAAESFLKKNPLAYPAVLSGDSGIVDAYQVTSFPTFVMIGRDGKVAAYQVGYGDVAMLRGMLAKAGVQ
jgi:thiol-disulfide isomerase/thioredoxin/starvation-inducible outer membrane lipoprotein